MNFRRVGGVRDSVMCLVPVSLSAALGSAKTRVWAHLMAQYIRCSVCPSQTSGWVMRVCCLLYLEQRCDAGHDPFHCQSRRKPQVAQWRVIPCVRDGWLRTEVRSPLPNRTVMAGKPLWSRGQAAKLGQVTSSHHWNV